MPSSRMATGFSLIELMIALVIASLLAVVAIPAYRDHMIRGAIPQATGGLSLFAMQMEEYYQDHHTYASGSNCGAATFPASSVSKLKTFSPSLMVRTPAIKLLSDTFLPTVCPSATQ